MSNNAGPAVAAIPGFTSGAWELDAAHSDIAICVRNLLIGTVRGRFSRYDVTLVTGEDPLDSSVTATIDLASVDTGNQKRDEHLRSSTFFDVAEHPTATYRSTGVRRAAEGWTVDGELTLHGVTRSVPLSVTAVEFGAGARRAGFGATAHVDRAEFGLARWSGGGLLSGTTAAISLELQLVRR